ncbi:MAG: peptide chain release factor N(5)-glutamine methyltransferase [Hyphomicrobiales bacterium]
MTIGLAASTGRSTAFRAVRDALRAQGLATPELDARVLLFEALSITAEEFARNPDAAIGEAGAGRLEVLAGRRLDREPIARIIGKKEFFGLDFAVTEATLVPRPDTETLVEAVLSFVDDGPGRGAALTIADLGTGSGCILVALLDALPAAEGLGVDLSADAVAVAAGNAERLGVGERARFVAGDFSAAAGGSHDIVVSNPPYIERSTISGLDREVAAFEPVLALDGGVDGLDAYRAIAALAAGMVRAGGLVALETGIGQAGAVAGLLGPAGFTDVAIRRDLAGIERVVTGRQKAGD